MTKPRWSDLEPVVMDDGLSSETVERADHAGKMFKHSTICNGQCLIKYNGPTADDVRHQRAHLTNKD